MKKTILILLVLTLLPAINAIADTTIVIDWGRGNPTGTDPNGIVWNDIVDVEGTSVPVGVLLEDAVDITGTATTIDFEVVATAGSFASSNQYKPEVADPEVVDPATLTPNSITYTAKSLGDYVFFNGTGIEPEQREHLRFKNLETLHTQYTLTLTSQRRGWPQEDAEIFVDVVDGPSLSYMLDAASEGEATSLIIPELIPDALGNIDFSVYAPSKLGTISVLELTSVFVPPVLDINGDDKYDDLDLNLLLSDFDGTGLGGGGENGYNQDDLETLLELFGSEVGGTQSVPEPASIFLMLFGTMGLLAVRRQGGIVKK